MQEFDRSTEASVDRALRSALVADGVVLVLALLLFWYALSYARRLETQVQLRTADLKQSNRQLESYNFIISHDLRAPMRTMLGFATALEEDFGTSVPPDLADYIQRIKNAGQHMTRLINDLLAYSRLQRAEVPLTSVSLEQVARQAAARVAEAGGGGVQKIDVPGDAIVTANPQVLQQAVDNLVDNARKFTKPGSANRVEISARRAGSMWRLEVSDSGIGIKPEHQQEIFEVFRRLHSSEQYEGTGAGLAIVKTGVERMGGRVGVKSAAGEGSTFWIELPTSAK
jgi:signal transduction histidine kinase